MRTWMWTSTQSLFAAALVGIFLSGCGGADLSGYRPVEKSQVSSPAQVDTEHVIDVQSTNQQAPAYSETVLTTISESAVDILPVSALVPVNVIDGSSVSALLKTTPMDAVAPEIQPASASAETKVEKPRAVELLIPDKSFSRDPASKGWRVSYDDLDLLKVLNMEPVTEDAVELMPAWLKGLDGQRIRIRGFMYPTFEAEGIERFVLARDNQICCFGRDPKIYDLVQVDMRAGKTTHYIPATRAFDVIGRFKIDLESEGGKHLGLYYIEDAEIVER